MGATATAPACEEQVQVRRERRPCARLRGVTVGQLLTRAHESVAAGSAASCPMCGAAMKARAKEAHCRDCGTRLI